MRQLVSIVIPMFNAERFLARTLSSVQKQTYDNLQILIVDDGSTDAAARIAEQYAHSDQRIQIITQRNGGVASARNAGLRHALGEYVAFLDADDIWHPTKIERQVEVLLASTNATGLAAVYTLYRYIDAQDRVIESGKFWSLAGGLATHLVTTPVGNGSSILVRRDVALEVGGFDPTYKDFDAGGAEDLDFELKLVARFPVGVIPEYLVGYRVYEDNMSDDKSRMVRAKTAVVERHIRLNPGLSKRCVRWARGELHGYLFFTCLSGRHFGGALVAMARLVLSDPVLATSLLWQVRKWPAQKIRRSVRHQLRRAAGCRPIVAAPIAPRSTFYDASPQETGPLPHPILRELRVPILVREDVGLSSAFRISSPDTAACQGGNTWRERLSFWSNDFPG
jgi:glycosyltransferase involved in cell wall biosynthesis